MGDTILTVDNLRIVSDAGVPIVQNVSFSVARGEVLALIGASGSGKTTLALSALGHLRPGLHLQEGRVTLAGIDLLAAPRRQLNGLRGRKVAYVAQSAAAAFNPRIRLMNQVTEAARIHRTQWASSAQQRALALFQSLSLPDPERVSRRFPHEVSGGQLQRFMIAMGLQEEPLLLVCDEPTSALDVTTQVEVMRLLKRAIHDNNTAALFVSHDLAVVAQIATRIIVLRSGHVVETGTTEEILNRPQADYTKELIAACRHLSVKAAGKGSTQGQITHLPAASPLLEVSRLTAGYGRLDNGQPVATTLRDVSLRVGRGEIVAVIGESGSGKTTLARVIAGLHEPASGTVMLQGKSLAGADRSRSLDERRLVQLVFQTADTALNPKQKIRQILGRTLKFFHGTRRQAAEARMIELLNMVQLPATYLDRLPSELSGGEKQRVNLARALAANPEVLICDEITSALDTIVARSIIALIERLRSELGLAIIFISHDLATVASIADRVTVLRQGRVVESGSAATVLAAPADPYTKLLIASVPELRPGWLEEAVAARQQLELAPPGQVAREDRASLMS
ncbi:ABC transporter ATP-binding protein [Rhodoligotrophos ferricapiens]|uniref:ABC transporter ATP-binding protein n=1 Tax=Rhodoligotrophos ferricapiens TaxID=3069264 RepID=UPI00315CCA63